MDIKYNFFCISSFFCYLHSTVYVKMLWMFVLEHVCAAHSTYMFCLFVYRYIFCTKRSIGLFMNVNLQRYMVVSHTVVTYFCMHFLQRQSALECEWRFLPVSLNQWMFKGYIHAFVHPARMSGYTTLGCTDTRAHGFKACARDFENSNWGWNPTTLQLVYATILYQDTFSK